MNFSSQTFRLGLSMNDGIAKEVASEIASTLGIYGKMIEYCVREQNRLIEQIRAKAGFLKKNEVDVSFSKEKSSIAELVDEYNENQKAAQKYQYYLNIQKEALGFRGFDYDPYNIPPKISIVR